MFNKLKIILKNNKKKVSILSLVLFLVIVLGFSYAWLRTTIYGDKDVQITVGEINLVLNEESDGIQLVNVIPTYDEEGKEGTPYKFSLENKSGISLYYTLSLADDLEALSNCQTTSGSACEMLDFKDVRYELKMGDRVFTGTLSDSPVISYGIINKDEIINCELKVWLNIKAGNDAMGKVYLGKLKVFATQNVDLFDFEQGDTNVNEPVMDNNMIAVKHDGYSWVKTDIDNGWYNYDMGIWANAVTVTEESRSKYLNAAVGTEISMDDIETMWVWIPRYSYTIAGNNGSYFGKRGTFLDSEPNQSLPGEIDVKFVSTDVKDRGSANYLETESLKNWYTPDAFTFGDTELSGIWVGKFETSNIVETSENVSTYDPIIKPNVVSWRNINISNIYNVGLKVSSEGNRYGLSTTMNSHAMRNDEWGVVAYLSQSRYGKIGNVNFSGKNKEIYQNKSEQYITGCSWGAPSGGSSANYGCQYKYDDNIRTEDGSTGKGVGASTTGTIYGIYDMSGGAWEYVMGNYNKVAGGSGLSNPITIEDKYYNLYTSTDASKACNGDVCRGHALSETAGWYGDYQNMLTTTSTWFLRGGFFDLTIFFDSLFSFCVWWFVVPPRDES